MLQRDGLVAIPTETVYGLAANARSDRAIQKLYAVKGRPENHPVIVHIYCIEQLWDWAIDVPDAALKLAEAFWPGPMTLVLRKHPSVSPLITGGQDTIAIRIPSHPVTLELLKQFNGAVVAPSANKFGHISPTAPQHVLDELGDAIDGILEAGGDGACEIGIESCIIDVSASQPDKSRARSESDSEAELKKESRARSVSDSEAIFKISILRQGMITEAMINEVLGQGNSLSHKESDIKAPGSLPSHYAPTCQAYLVTRDTLESLPESEEIGVIALETPVTQFTHVITLPNTPREYAQKLYESLRTLETTCESILIEAPPEAPEWQGIWDRLLKATAVK